jgi:hypothetical protein
MPVVPPQGDIEAVGGGRIDRRRDLRRIPHDFFGNAPDVDTRASEPARLEDGGPRTILRCSLRRGQTTAAAAQHYQIEPAHVTNLDSSAR